MGAGGATGAGGGVGTATRGPAGAGATSSAHSMKKLQATQKTAASSLPVPQLEHGFTVCVPDSPVRSGRSVRDDHSMTIAGGRR